MHDLMQQIVYWHVPVWQLLLAAIAIAIGGGWLLYSHFRDPPSSPFPIDIWDTQPMFFYEAANGISGLNAAAQHMLLSGKDEHELAVLVDLMAEALAEERVLIQHDWPQSGTALLIFPAVGKTGNSTGALGMITANTIHSIAATTGIDINLIQETETDAPVWQSLTLHLQHHTTGARVRVKRQSRWEENELSYAEQQLLQFLINHAGKVQTAETLFAIVWQENPTDHGLQPIYRDRLRRLVYQLRRNIEPIPHNPTHLITVHGVGYIFHTQQPT